MLLPVDWAPHSVHWLGPSEICVGLLISPPVMRNLHQTHFQHLLCQMASKYVVVHIDEDKEAVALSLPSLDLCNKVHHKETCWQKIQPVILNISKLLLIYCAVSFWFLAADIVCWHQSKFVIRVCIEQCWAPTPNASVIGGVLLGITCKFSAWKGCSPPRLVMSNVFMCVMCSVCSDVWYLILKPRC